MVSKTIYNKVRGKLNSLKIKYSGLQIHKAYWDILDRSDENCWSYDIGFLVWDINLQQANALAHFFSLSDENHMSFDSFHNKDSTARVWIYITDAIIR